MPDEIEVPIGPEDGGDAAQPTETPAKKVAELDAYVPVSDDIDEDFRDKPLSEVFRVAKQHKEEAKKAYGQNAEMNNLRSRAEMAERLVQSLNQRQQPAYDPQEVTQRMLADPLSVLAPVIQQHMQPVMQELQQLRQQTAQGHSEMARERARGAVGVDAKAWNEYTPAMAALMFARNQNPDDPNAWIQAFEPFKAAVGAKVTLRPNDPPPVGQARSTPSRESAPKLSSRDERNLAELADMAGIKKGTPAWDRLVKDIANDPVAMGAWGNE